MPPVPCLFFVEFEETHNPFPIGGFRPGRQMLEPRHFVKLILEAGLGVWQQCTQRRTSSLCWYGLWGHNRHKNMLDSNFSPAYTHFMKKDRLHNEASII